MQWRPAALSERIASHGLRNRGFFEVDRVRRRASIGGAASDAEQQAHAYEQQEKIRASAADKWQWQALVRKRAGHDTDIDERLQADQKRYAGGQQRAEGIARVPGDVNAAQEQRHKRGDNTQGGDETGFLPDVGEDEIRPDLRQVIKFLPATAQAQTGPAA